MSKMDKLLRRILGILLGLYAAKAFAEDVAIDDLETYYKHITTKVNQEFESMLDNWAADYIGVANNNPETVNKPPVMCPTPNATDENGDLLACVIPAVNDENVNVNNAINGTAEVQSSSVKEGLHSVHLNNSLIRKMYDQLRWYIQDPLPLPDEMKLKQLQNFLVMYGNTKDVKIAGLSKYELTDADVAINVSGVSMTNKLRWPLINVSGLYELDISGPRVHLYGSGPFSINISDILLSFNAGLGENDNKTVRLDSFDIDMNVGNASIKLENFLDGSAAGDTANSFLNEILPQALTVVLPQFKETVQKKVMQYANACFNHLYVHNVTDFIDRYFEIDI